MKINKKKKDTHIIEEELIEGKIKKLKTTFLIVIIITLLISAAVIFSISYPMNECSKDSHEHITGNGKLDFSFRVEPEVINASDKSTVLVFLFTLKNIGNTSIRVIAPIMQFTIQVLIIDSHGKPVTSNFGDPVFGDVYDEDTIILTSPKLDYYINTSIAEHWHIYSTVLGYIYNHPDNYTIKAIYTTHFFDDDVNGKKLNKISLEYWHGSVESNSAVLQAY